MTLLPSSTRMARFPSGEMPTHAMFFVVDTGSVSDWLLQGKIHYCNTNDIFSNTSIWLFATPLTCTRLPCIDQEYDAPGGPSASWIPSPPFPHLLHFPPLWQEVPRRPCCLYQTMQPLHPSCSEVPQQPGHSDQPHSPLLNDLQPFALPCQLPCHSKPTLITQCISVCYAFSTHLPAQLLLLELLLLLPMSDFIHCECQVCVYVCENDV